METMKRQNLMTVKELSSYLNIHEQTIYKMIYKKQIPFIKIKGIGYRFNTDEIEQWINKGHEVPITV